MRFDTDYPEIDRNHNKTKPKTVAASYANWIAATPDFYAVDPLIVVDRFSNTTRDVRMFFATFHSNATGIGRSDTWNNILQKLFISEVT